MLTHMHTSHAHNNNTIITDNNTITVTVSSNFKLLSTCAPTITIKNLQNAIHAPGNFSVVVNSSSQFASTALWNVDETDKSHHVVIVLDEDTVASTEYLFSFVVRNPVKHQVSPAVEVELSGILVRKTSSGAEVRVDQAMDKDLGNVADAYNPCYLNSNCEGSWTWAREGTAAPLFVRNAAFEAGQAGLHHRPENLTNSGAFNHTESTFASQSSWQPCDLNTLTIEFKTNVPLNTVCSPEITLVGFVRTLSGDQELLISGPNASVFAATGAWSKADGKIVIQIRENTMPDMPYR